MAYITTAEIEDGLTGGATELRQITRSGGTLNQEVVDAAIAFATGKVDEYAEGTSGFPWTSTPQKAKDASFALVLWYLYGLAWTIPKSVQANYDATMKALESLSEGSTSWVSGDSPAKQNASKVFVWLPGDDRATTNPRRATRSILDTL